MGSIMQTLGRVTDEAALYEESVRVGLFNDARQRPMYLHPSLLPGQPWSVTVRNKNAVCCLSSGCVCTREKKRERDNVSLMTRNCGCTFG